jgi:hypothetical protein
VVRKTASGSFSMCDSDGCRFILVMIVMSGLFCSCDSKCFMCSQLEK